MKKALATALLVIAPLAAMADTAPQTTMVEVADADLAGVTGQALSISPDQIIMGLQQINTFAGIISPILPAQGKSVVSLINVAATTAPVVNNLVNGGKLSSADLALLLKNGVTAGVAISTLSSGL
ncbi:MAG: hypothetical protein ACM3VZ_05855 [Acidobacteriota bacterium]